MALTKKKISRLGKAFKKAAKKTAKKVAKKVIKGPAGKKKTGGTGPRFPKH